MSERKPNRPGRFLRKKKDTGIRLVIPFLAALAVLTVVSFIIPLRPTVSQMEKRELAAFPEFSWNALVEGTYFDEISTWYSDTFPGREGWLLLATNIESLHGSSEVAISGDLPVLETVPPITLPPQTQPAEQPLPEETIPATEAAPIETAPTEPTEWNGVDAGEEAIIAISDTAVIQIGDSAFNALGFSANASGRLAESIGGFADRMKEQGIRVVSAPAPTSVGVLIEPEYLSKLKCADQNEMLQYIHGLMSDSAIKIDTHAVMTEHMSEYIYFRTDHHWTARGAYYVYEAVMEALGKTPKPLEEFREWDMGEFEGSLFYKVARPHKLKEDNLYAYVTDDNVTMTIYSTNNDTGKGVQWDMIQDMTKRGKNEKYSAFLRNDNPLSVLINHDLPEGTACMVVKDSFGNCLAPYFTQNYHTVYVVDYRKFHGDIKTFLETHEVQDIIFAPYMIATQSEAGNDLFKRLCRE